MFAGGVNPMDAVAGKFAKPVAVLAAFSHPTTTTKFLRETFPSAPPTPRSAKKFLRGRERPSLFPNGINPLDAAAERFAKPVPTAVFAARAQSIGPAGLAGIVPVTLLSTPSSILKQNKLTLDLELEFYEMLAPLRALPEHIFDNLEVAVKAVSLEKRL
ncbi:unnamed protein product [Gongylonema pulchrum]|uniref:WS_DGAT_C domain-containing protein n=1 Tax=Gongylonema pulchrum TaxID=637853 RepID=A0A183E3C8_9BILA|nr:unnamed protein product [Gongylonema pulchrum]